MHPEIAQCLRMLARLNYIMGEHGEAMAFQQKVEIVKTKSHVDATVKISNLSHKFEMSFCKSTDVESKNRWITIL